MIHKEQLSGGEGLLNLPDLNELRTPIRRDELESRRGNSKDEISRRTQTRKRQRSGHEEEF